MVNQDGELSRRICFRQTKPLRSFACFLIFLLSSSLSHAKPWRVHPLPPDQSTLEKLLEKYPDIANSSDLQNLLRDFANHFPLEKLSAEEKDREWVLDATYAEKIVAIDFRLVSRALYSQLDALSQTFLGFTDSTDLRNHLDAAIRKLLKDRGYPQPKIGFTVHERDGGVRYRYRIDYGSPCLIESIHFAFTLPEKISFNVEPGDICDRDLITAAVDKVFDELTAEGFSQARFEPVKFVMNNQSNTMKVLVAGTLGKKVKYEINDPIKKFVLGDIFTTSEIKDLTPGTISPEAMIADIKIRYQNRGYDDVAVTGPSVIDNAPNSAVYMFNVDPGVYYELSDLQFQGATVFSAESLRGFMNFGGTMQTAPPLNSELLQQGIDAIKARYRERGYWDVDIQEPRISKNRETGKAQALIVIDEGRQHRLAGVEIKGNTAFTSDELKNEFPHKVGDTFDQAKLVDFEKSLRNQYINAGYLYVETNVSMERRSALSAVFVSIIVQIDEGERIKIGEIQVKGLVHTAEKVVTREIFFETGQDYDPEVIDASRRALLALGIFQSVQIIPADRNAATERSSTLDLVIEVREAKPGTVSFGPGWSLLRGNRFVVESSYNNIGGVGRQIFARGQISEEVHQKAIANRTMIGRSLSIGYLEPYLFDLPVNGTASGSNSARADDHWVMSTTGELALTHKFRYFLLGSSISSYYAQKLNREESSEEEKIGYLRLLGGNVRSGRFGLRFGWDHRNSVTWPTEGFMVNAEIARALFKYGGNLAYRYWQLSFNKYFMIFPSTVFAAGFSLEAFENVDRQGGEADMLPQSEALFVGGAETVRGFSERSLGPEIVYGQDIHDILGGSHSGVYKTELRQKVYGDSAAMTLFADMGNVFFRDEEIDHFTAAEAARPKSDGESPTRINDNVDYEFAQLIERPEYVWTKNYAAYGLAFNYLTPLGSINLAYGLPWKRCADEGDSCVERGIRSRKHWVFDGVFHVNIGTRF